MSDQIVACHVEGGWAVRVRGRFRLGLFETEDAALKAATLSDHALAHLIVATRGLAIPAEAVERAAISAHLAKRLRHPAVVGWDTRVTGGLMDPRGDPRGL